MKLIKHMAIAGALSSSLLVVGCGGSSSNDSSQGSPASLLDISGTAEAPSGAVAHYETQSALQLALNFFVSPLAAAITGLDPISGATVELIRVDNNGAQEGDVLATTVTSVTGDYTLTLPEGVNLAGNLVVRINGSNDSLRAQVVEKDVDISPVSEFVLRKFVSQGAALDQLLVTDVVKLSGRVEEFDITLANSVNLEAAFSALENEIGDFVESEVAVAASTSGNAAGIAGDYRSSAFSFALHDSDNNTFGTYANDLWASTFTFANNGNGDVTVTHLKEDSAYGDLSGSALNQSNIYYEAETETINESFAATLTASGILSITGEFEEDIEEDYGWRYPAGIYNLQQVADTGLFFMVSNEGAVRYETTDTNNDGINDAIDPDLKSGDEVFRTLEIFSRQPTAFTNSDLSGKFGRVFLESWLASDTIELQTEINTLTFDGAGNFDYGAVNDGHLIGLSSSGTSYESITEAGELNQPMVITPDGDITSAGGEPSDGFISDTFDFLAFAEAEGTNQQDAQTSKTLLVKLPTTAPTVTDNRYRMLLTSMKLGAGAELLMSSSKFNTFLTMGSETSGNIDGAFFEVRKTGLGGDISVSTDTAEAIEVDVALGGADISTLTVSGEGGGTTTMEGFFNENATLGVFALSYTETANSDPDELGLVVLIKTSD
ncbi:hypothetical protein [Marinobacter sp. 1_MG-2023]|uniref:hypothetical protein n=1 Tax=Marinobacter sp. 1_MG-2023 TaxID=3062627 RepID=UPI0026E2D1CC|nr:hypothetical protein [Marinobacter sp. 1_MG-2023]MDO6822587.1 hypothetical protein [Marinobacter sp. 1_MG-2023]